MPNKNKPNKNKKNNRKKLIYGIITVILIAALCATYYFIFFKENTDKEDENKVAYTQLIKDINDKKIEKIEMTTGSTNVKVKYVGDDDKKMKNAVVPNVQAFIELIQKKG